MSSLDEGQQIQPDLIIQQIRRAFSIAGGEWGNNSQIAENLQPCSTWAWIYWIEKTWRMLPSSFRT